MITVYKLLRVRKNGTLGSLFIDRKTIIPINVWLKAKDCKTKGYAHRPGFHCTTKMSAPHLSPYGRAWCECDIEGYEPFKRPSRQGGLWYIAQRMRITKVVKVHPPKRRIA